MGLSLKPGTSGSGSTPSTLAEINVTPLVDVMLVLLIVFMISAPLMQQGIQVDLPKANAPTLGEVPDQLILTIKKNHQLTINGKTIEKGTLRVRLEAIVSVKPDVEVFIQADQGVPYGVVARAMAEVKQSKINRVGLVTQPGTEDGP